MGIHNEVESVKERFFSDRSWMSHTCDSCGSEYYAKPQTFNCGSYDCEQGHKFLEIPPPKKFLGLGELDKDISRFLDERGYVRSEPIALSRSNERTLFASTAGQVFDHLIYSGEGADHEEKIHCFQPVVRFQGFATVGRLEGVSTSFVNIGTEQWNASPEEHYKNLDDWLDLFSKLAFYVGNLTLKHEFSVNDWGGLQVPTESVRLEYKGLEVGIANYFFEIPQQDGKQATLSDISIGLERLMWAINRTDSYFDAIGPLLYSIGGDVEYLDSIRTLTLMAASGVKPGPNNQGNKFRMLAKRATRPLQMLPLIELVQFYRAQWSQYTDLPFGIGAVTEGIRQEVGRNTNIYINQLLTGKTAQRVSERDLKETLKKNPRALFALRRKLGES